MPEIESWFVIVMGLGTVFIGLICIILLCKILGAVCSIANKKSDESAPAPRQASALVPTPAPAPTPVFQNRGEVIAAIGAAIAETEGVDLNAIRITSIRRIGAAAPAPAVSRRGEVIAAIGAAVAEAEGVGVNALRILSIKRV